ncbi:diguanylate cyclase [Ferrimonas sp. SCSIO 43195]|uniref:sensor domain-containing diguanylate cyclase n=1 Tax=Ferrimonas sp. SCSIO 43195 TaxID=2822844 RepID=UPI00207515F2|nr:diguanylate cyclase [Ferrimonas sp. SCSIO 43195]USD38900.1 diguanylate cyclase [Ferrimonas sp. SCSIO 43195]
MSRESFINRWLSKRSLSNRNSYLLLSVCFIVFGIAVALLSSLINYRLQSTNIDQSVEHRFDAEKNLKLEKLRTSVASLESMVTALAENPLTLAYIDAPSEERLQAMNNLFLMSARSQPEYMQVRYLDRSGMERVRVDRRRGDINPALISPDRLQNKSQRYYFAETRHLPARQHWHSKLDLNRENGALEQPIRPTFRVATPIYVDNRFAGMVIINTEAKLMLKELTRAVDFEVLLVDGDGEVLVSPNSAQSWSRYLPNRSTLFDMMPALAPAILAGSDSRNTQVHSFSIDELFDNGEKLKVIMTPTRESLTQMMEANTLAALLIAGSVILISFPLSWVAAVVPAHLQNRLQDTLGELRRTTERLDQHVITSSADAQGRITQASSAFCETSGYKLWELKGKTHAVVRHPENPLQQHQEIRQALSNGLSWRGELRNLHKEGQEYWVDTVITPELDSKGQVIGFSQVATDITDRKAIEKMSVTDVLTNVHNRRRLDQLMLAEMERYQRYQQFFSVILMDLDHFKAINDSLGHQIGDEVLVQVAQSMKENVRKVDHLGRWGGEEFLVICSGTDEASAGLLAEKLRALIEQMPMATSVTASFGVAQTLPGERLNQLIKRVDQSLYRAKEQGRNRVVLASGASLS